MSEYMRPPQAFLLSVDGSVDDTLNCSLWMASEEKPQQFRISYDTAWNLLSNLTSILRHVADTRLRSAVAGDCIKCKNLRLVDVERPGRRSESVYCPSCRHRYDNAEVHFVTGSHRA